MLNRRKEVKLRNVIFPLWMLCLFPGVWLIVLPGNFIIDSLVLLISLSLMKIPNKKQLYKRHIFKIFGFGLLADVIGSAYMLLLLWGLEIGETGTDPYLTIPALLISAGLIFVFNYFVTFKREDKALRLKLSLIFAVITAPYTFLVPTSWLY